MTEAIVTSRPLPLLEGGYAEKTPVTQGDNGNGQALLLQGMEQLALLPSPADPYAVGQQLLAQNQSLLPLIDLSSSAPLHFMSTKQEDIQDGSRQLHRELQQSSDSYSKAVKSLKLVTGASQGARVVGNEGTPPHIDALESLINTIHGGYQKTYSDINQKAAQYMKDVNTALGKMSDFIRAGGDGKIHFRPEDFLKEMHKTFTKYTEFNPKSTKDYHNWSPDDSSTKAIHTFRGDETAFKFWKEKLGDGFIVKQVGSDSISIYPNLSAIRQIHASVAKISLDWGGGDMASQSFQSLQTAIDSQKNSVNNGVSQLLERFRQDNSTFETMIQLLTKMTEDLHRYNAGYLQ
ncbi:IpaD/SipD/SspD family type III secretion system needle tip protein [Yersinia bercovieri]|uniref:IpaD/SipD/SspD family type III secretion system needle tip protein n=1 Tax=Yersinia bercovieri TaxID=634 RepID=UPI0011AB498F|nr:IpaD/SipD/SspD family type III secretion system needle tip protein [Yersinia bercovieri]